MLFGHVLSYASYQLPPLGGTLRKRTYSSGPRSPSGARIGSLGDRRRCWGNCWVLLQHSRQNIRAPNAAERGCRWGVHGRLARTEHYAPVSRSCNRQRRTGDHLHPCSGLLRHSTNRELARLQADRPATDRLHLPIPIDRTFRVRAVG